MPDDGRTPEQRLKHKITSRYDAASGHWSPLIDHWRALLRDYHQELKLVVDSETGEVRWPFRSKLHTPKTFEKIETIVPNLVSAIFDKDPFISVTPHPGNYDYDKVKKTETLLYHQLRHIDFRSRAVPIIQQAVMIGTSVVRLKWRYDAQYVTKRQTVYEFGIPVGVAENRELEEVYEGPDIVEVPFYRFFIDPATPPGNLQAASYIIEEIVQSWDDFQKDAEYLGYKNRSQVRRLVSHGGTAIGEYDERAIPDDIYAHDVKILLYHDKEDIVYMAVSPYATNSAGVIVKHQKFDEVYPSGDYPYIAFHVREGIDQGVDVSDDAVADYKPGGFYPPGDIDPLHGLQAVHNTSINQKIDQVSLGLSPPLIVPPEYLEDEEDLAFGYHPGQILHSRGGLAGTPSQSIYQVPIVDHFGASYAHHMNMIDDMFDRALGVHDTITGKSDSKNRTATGTMVLTENAMKRFSLKVFILTKKGIQKMLVAMTNMNAEMLDPETAAYQTGSTEPIYVNPEDVIRGAQFKIRVAPFYSKQVIADTALSLLQPMMESYPFANLTEMWRLILENLEFVEDASLIIPEDMPPVMPIQIQDVGRLKDLVAQAELGYQKTMGQSYLQQTKPQPATKGAKGTAGVSGNVKKVDPVAETKQFMRDNSSF